MVQGERPRRRRFWIRGYRMTDQALLISTLREAGRIIGEYIEPGPGNAEQTLTRLIAVLETQDLAHAIERVGKGDGLGVVKWRTGISDLGQVVPLEKLWEIHSSQQSAAAARP